MRQEDIEKAELAVKDFFDSLGPDDIYKRIFLEALLEEVYGQKIDLSDVMKEQQD